MFVMDRGRIAHTLIVSAVIGVVASQGASAQLSNLLHKKTAAPEAAKAETKPVEQPHLETVRLPTNTTDPIAVINGEVITRQQLADECVARKGSEILDTMIARRLIEQEMRKKKMEITAADIDAEIDRVAQNVGHVSREVWLRTLDKERGISPATYARDIIYPSLALRKLAVPRVQVTEQDIADAFEANFGPRLRCRIIMTNDIRKATEIWEELRKNPGGFEKLAQEKSLDSATRSFGGLLPDPISRHANPRNVSDPAFRQLVDGDPADKNPAHKPKDGDITGPIQVNDDAWLVMKREALAPGKTGSPNDKTIHDMLTAQMFDVKLQDAVNSIYGELMNASSIDNKLTGQVKEAHEEKHPEYQAGMGTAPKLKSDAGVTPSSFTPKTREVSPERTSAAGASGSAPAGVPTSAAETANALKNTIQTAPRSAPR